MEKIKYIAIGVISIGIGILIGLSVKQNPLANIIVTNSSSKIMHTVSITVGMTSYIVDNIEPGKNKSVNVYVVGEAGYRIKVNFANGDSLINWNYIETGNKINETVSDTNIVSSFIQH